MVEEGEAELSESLRDSKEERGADEVEGIARRREGGSSKEGVLEDSLDDFDGEICRSGIWGRRTCQFIWRIFCRRSRRWPPLVELPSRDDLSPFPLPPSVCG